MNSKLGHGARHHAAWRYAVEYSSIGWGVLIQGIDELG
jgi:hypothetical protein